MPSPTAIVAERPGASRATFTGTSVRAVAPKGVT